MIENFGFTKVYKTKFDGDLKKLQENVIPKLEEKFFSENSTHYLVERGQMSFVPVDEFNKDNKRDLKDWIDFYNFLVFLKPHLEKYASLIDVPITEIEIITMWVNKYPKTSFIKEHAHIQYKNTHSFVFYIRKPFDSGNLFIRDPKDKKIYEVPSLEGEVVIFPSDIPHYTTPNNSIENKYVIAADVSFGNKELDPDMEKMIKKYREDNPSL